MPAAHVLEAGANRCAHATGQSVRAETGPSPPYARRSRRRARCRMHRPRRRGCTPVASIAARVRSPPMTAEPAPGRSSVGTGSGRFLARRSHGATSCTASRSIPFLLTLPAFTEARPEHRRFGRRSPPVADVAVRRNVVPGARAPPDTLEGDAGGLCRPRARYSARGAPRRCTTAKVRADARCHASCAAPDAAALPPARAGRRMAKQQRARVSRRALGRGPPFGRRTRPSHHGRGDTADDISSLLEHGAVSLPGVRRPPVPRRWRCRGPRVIQAARARPRPAATRRFPATSGAEATRDPGGRCVALAVAVETTRGKGTPTGSTTAAHRERDPGTGCAAFAVTAHLINPLRFAQSDRSSSGSEDEQE